MNEHKLVVCMMEALPEDAPQEAKDIAEAVNKEKRSFKDVDAYKGIEIGKYLNPTGYGGRYQH